MAAKKKPVTRKKAATKKKKPGKPRIRKAKVPVVKVKAAKAPNKPAVKKPKVKKAPIAPKATKQARANWGANEHPRQCRSPGCDSTESEVTNTVRKFNPERILRYRKCSDCGQKYSTIEAL